MICSVEGCERPVHGRGYCGTHYARWRRNGAPTLQQSIVPTCHPDRDHYAHGQCAACYLRTRSFPSTTDEYRRSRHDPVRQRELRMARHYGLTVDECDAMLEAQGGTCAICDGPPNGRWSRFVVDHDHETGEVRGLLCSHCNTAIGLFRDDPAIMAKAISYVEAAAHRRKR